MSHLRQRNFGDFHLVTFHQVQKQVNRTAKDRTCNLEIQKTFFNQTDNVFANRDRGLPTQQVSRISALTKRKTVSTRGRVVGLESIIATRPDLLTDPIILVVFQTLPDREKLWKIHSFSMQALLIPADIPHVA